MTHLFPPAMVPALRASVDLGHVTDEELTHVLMTVFFASLEPYEGKPNPIRVVLTNVVGDVVLADELGAAYRWKILRFSSPRPFAVPELVKLSAATAQERVHVDVHSSRAGLVIGGLASAGIDLGTDAWLKVAAPGPGRLVISRGEHDLVHYEHGSVRVGDADVLSRGPVRRSLETLARAARAEPSSDYVEVVRSLVRAMVAHGHGGMVVIDPAERPGVVSAYAMATPSTSLVSLLRLAALVRGGDVSRHELRRPLDDALRAEAKRVVEELGALTAIDGAVVLNRELALVAFGAILPIGQHLTIEEVTDVEAAGVRAVDLGDRGTRHRAAASYAASHAGSVVFVTSEDGQTTCMLSGGREDHALMWRLDL